jgi:hypothetical protein
MKKQIIFLSILGLLYGSNINAQSFDWAVGAGGTSGDRVYSVTVDISGNVYSCGDFQGTVDFDPGPGTFNMTSFGAEDIFIRKLDASGNLVWVKQIGGSNIDQALSIKLDASNNILIGGWFYGTTDFDPGIGVSNQTSLGLADIFVCKLDASGNFVWAKRMGSASSDEAWSIAIDASDNIYTTGGFQSTVDFDPGAGFSNLTSSGSIDVFVSKLDASGNFVWAKRIGGTNAERAYGICLDNAGNVYSTGYFTGTADFDPGASTFNLISSAGSTDVFISKLDATGNFIWAKQMGGTGIDQGRSIAIDASGNVYTTGEFSNTVDFDPGIGTLNLNSAGSLDAFISKLDASGNFVWAKSYGGTDADNSYSVAINQHKNILTTGSFSSAVDFDPGSGTFSLSSFTAAQDVYVNKLDSLGNFIWAGQMGGSSAEVAFSIAIDINDYFYFGGYYFATADFDAGTGVSNLNATGSFDSFVAKYANCSSVPTTPGSISGTTTICEGTSNTYSISSVSGATSYTWTLPGGWSGTSATNSITTTANATSGSVSVTANNACGSSSAASLAISVNTIPSIPGAISGTTTICVGTSNTYSISSVGGASSYTWTLPSGWSGTSTTNSITTTANATGGNMSVTANNACGSSSAQTLAITVNTIPSTPGTISGTTTICSGSNNTYSISAVPGATSYTWTLPGGWTGTSTTNSIIATASATSGNISVTANNACGSSSAQTSAITVNTPPATPGAISGTSTICSGTSNTYSITAVPGATSYTWTLPGGWSGTSTTNSISTTADASSGTISVIANNSCGSSSAQTFAVTVNTPPATPGIILGSTTICSGSSNIYSVTNDPSASSYTWTLPSGWSGTSTTNSISTTADPTSGTISVNANNACGSSSVQTLVVTVNTIPAVPGTISGTTTICEGTSNTYSISPVSGATSYTWTLPSGWNGTSISNSITTIANSDDGTISVTANNACGSSTSQNLSITVNTLPTVTLVLGSNLDCDYESAYALSGGLPAGGTYSGTGVNSGNFDPGLAGAGSHTITYTYTDGNSCTNFDTDLITVDDCLGVDENGEVGFSVFPNPVSSDLIISTSSFGPGLISITIYDMVGQIVLQSNFNDTTVLLNVEAFQAGTYLVVMVKNDSICVERIIKH